MSPNGVRTVAGDIADWTNEALDSVLQRGEGDLVLDLAAPIPARAILKLLGLEMGNWKIYSDLWHEVFANPTSPQVFVDLGRVTTEVRQAVSDKRGDSGSDLIDRMWSTGLLKESVGRQSPDADQPGDVERQIEEGTPLALTLLGAGVDTTTNLFATVAFWLRDRPDIRARLLAMGNGREWERAIDEFLRFFPTAPAVARTVTQDTEFFGHKFEAGDRVLISVLAANRDPQVMTS